MQYTTEELNGHASPLHINLHGFKVTKFQGCGLQQVLQSDDGKRHRLGRIYSVKEFNRIIAAYRSLKNCDKRVFARFHIARYLSPSFGVVVTPLYTRVTFEEARRNIKPIMRSLLYALYICQSRHVAHRNVNLNSVMRVTIDEQNKGALPFVLTNFKYAVGISSKAFKRPKGLVRYRAPEAVGKSVPKKAGAAIDVWSAGVIFLELLLNDPKYFKYSDPENSKSAILAHSDDLLDTICRTEIEDKEAGDLLRGLLRVDYRQRISAWDALNHQYLKN